jgi:hypothetical protein
MEQMRNVYYILVGNHEGKRPLGRPKCCWENNITIVLREIGREGVHWMHPAQDRDQWRVVVNTEMYLRVP